MKWYIIELLGLERRAFVEGYSNKWGCPQQTSVADCAKPFSTKKEAASWARAYLPGYKIRITRTGGKHDEA